MRVDPGRGGTVMSEKKRPACLICGDRVLDTFTLHPPKDATGQHCPRCGTFVITGPAVAVLRTFDSGAVRECLSDFVEAESARLADGEPVVVMARHVEACHHGGSAG